MVNEILTQKIFGTEMFFVTFLIIIFESLILILAVFWYSLRTDDVNRAYYSIMLSLLIVYNIFMGLLPDKKLYWLISREFQVIVAFGPGFVASWYVSFYFYKVYNIIELKSVIFKLAFILLIVPYVIVFSSVYLITGDLQMGKIIHLILPMFYVGIVVYHVTKHFILNYILAENDRHTDWFNLSSAYFALILWCSLPVFVLIGDYQGIQVLITNGGFLLLSIIYLRSSIKYSRTEYYTFLEQEQLVNNLMEKLNGNRGEITSLILELSQEQSVLSRLKEQFFLIEPKIRTEFPSVTSLLKDGFRDKDRWTVYFESFNKAHNGFYEKVKLKYPQLSETELRHLSFIKLNLTSDEIARLLEVSESTLRKYRYRTKKKLQLEQNLSLKDFVGSF